MKSLLSNIDRFRVRVNGMIIASVPFDRMPNAEDEMTVATSRRHWRHLTRSHQSYLLLSLELRIGLAR